MEVGKNFFAASSIKKMSRFEEVSPEEIKRIVDNATPINTKRSTNFNTYSPVQTAQRSSHVVDRSSQDRCTISATATSKFTTTTASPAEQLIEISYITIDTDIVYRISVFSCIKLNTGYVQTVFVAFLLIKLPHTT